MAKINILFDNKNYQIDEKSLSNATSKLQSHLSDTMNGSGETINFGGQDYSIDAAKLQSSRNDFVYHLGGIAGNGYKVVVDGVEYSVDSEKVADAVSILHTTLGNLQSGATALPAIGKTAEEYTWAEIKMIADAGVADKYFELGDSKTFTLNDNEVVMEMVAFNKDTKADGSGTAGITFISKDAVASGREINFSNNNAGGWEACKMRSWLQSTFYDTLPSDIQDVIVSVDKTYYTNESGTLSCVDNVWIPSHYEIFGEREHTHKNGIVSESYGVDYSDYFVTSDNSHIIKYNAFGVDDYTWWLRTVDSSGSTHWATVTYVDYNGYTGCSESKPSLNNKGIVLGFCL